MLKCRTGLIKWFVPRMKMLLYVKWWTLFLNLNFFFRYRHIPKAKATAIADTPELKRIAENTKIQSNVQYHADFEKQKGKLTQVM